MLASLELPLIDLGWADGEVDQVSDKAKRKDFQSMDQSTTKITLLLPVAATGVIESAVFKALGRGCSSVEEALVAICKKYADEEN